MAVTREEFDKALANRMREAASLGHDHVDVDVGDLHRGPRVVLGVFVETWPPV